MREIFGIKGHQPLHHFHLSKQRKRGRSPMPGSLPTLLETLQCPRNQHHKPDKATILLQQLAPDPKTDQRNGISANPYQSTLTSHATVASAPSARNRHTTSKPATRSSKPSMISTTGLNVACTTSLIVHKCPIDRKTEIKTFLLPNASTKDQE